MFVNVERDGLVLRTVRAWNNPGLVHGFTERRGGVSRPPFSSLNMAFHVGDDPAAVEANRRRLCRALGVEPAKLVAGEQVHGRRIEVVGSADEGRGAFGTEDAVPGADGLVADEPGLLLIAFFADCTPILLYDPEKPAVGVVHAGWRGTALDAAGAAIETMVAAFGSRPGDVEAAIGPSIGPCCYEVGPEVAERIETAVGRGAEEGTAGNAVVSEVGGRLLVDLPRANGLLLQKAGLGADKVYIDGECTRCGRDRFFSHRGDGGRTGRFAAVIGLSQGGAA